VRAGSAACGGSTTGSLRVTPSCLACRARAVWQCRPVPSLSGLFPPCLAPPRPGSPQLQPGCCDSPAVGPFTPPSHTAPRGAPPCHRGAWPDACAADPAAPEAPSPAGPRPRPPPGASSHGCWRPTGRQPGGCRCGRPAGGTWSRACRGLSGSGRLARPPLGAHADRVEAGAGPVELALAAELVEQLVVGLLPHPGALPVVQPPPAGDRAAAAQLADGQQPPRDAGAQLVDDPGQTAAVIDAGAAAVAAWRCGQQGLDGLPQLLGDQGVGSEGHGRGSCRRAWRAARTGRSSETRS